MKRNGGSLMKILGLEFSSPQRRVAVVNTNTDGKVLTASEIVDASPGRSSKPLTMIEAALHEVGLQREQIECIAVGLGPGSYTGVRAAISVAQGWQLGHDVKLLGISGAECIAAQARADGVGGRFFVVIDAQREEFYLAGWETWDDQLHQIESLRLATRGQ